MPVHATILQGLRNHLLLGLSVSRLDGDEGLC